MTLRYFNYQNVLKLNTLQRILNLDQHPFSYTSGNLITLFYILPILSPIEVA